MHESRPQFSALPPPPPEALLPSGVDAAAPNILPERPFGTPPSVVSELAPPVSEPTDLSVSGGIPLEAAASAEVPANVSKLGHFVGRVTTLLRKVRPSSLTEPLSRDFQPSTPPSEKGPESGHVSSSPSSERPALVHIDQEVIADSDQMLSDDEIATALESQRVVKRAPLVTEIARDSTRTNTITHYSAPFPVPTTYPKKENFPVSRMSEHESVAGLLRFLDHARTLGKFWGEIDMGAHAADMAEHLTYIGERERQEAVRGIATYWKQWLRQDSSRQLCVLTEMTEDMQAHGLEEIKSDQFLLDNILGQFSDEELAELAPRLLTNTEQLSSDPASTKIVLLDDWMISGNQLASAYRRVEGRLPERYRPAIEIQLMTSPLSRIERGKFFSRHGEPVIVPVRSYFLSHRTTQQPHYAPEGHTSYETGSHSSVDYDFEVTYIGRMRTMLAEQSDKTVLMPPATNIRREYKYRPTPNVARLYVARNSLAYVQQEVGV